MAEPVAAEPETAPDADDADEFASDDAERDDIDTGDIDTGGDTTGEPAAVAGHASGYPGIQEIDDSHYTMSREVFEKFYSDPNAFSRQMRIVPTFEDEQPNGFRLHAVRPSSIFFHLGLRSGDQVRTINEMPLAGIESLLKVFEKLRRAKRIELGLIRDSASARIVIDIVSAR